MNYEEHEEVWKPKYGSEKWKGEHLQPWIFCGGRRRSLDRFGLMQRPRSTETEEKRDGGEARAVGGLQEEEDGEREKNEEGRGMPIYKEKCEQTGAKIEEEPNNGYPTT